MTPSIETESALFAAVNNPIPCQAMYYRCCTQIRNSDVITSRERTALFFCETKPLVRTQFIGIDEFAEKERRKYLRLAPSSSPPVPCPPPTCLSSTRVTKFALRFYTPSSPSPAHPTMIQPLLIALPHYCPTFMALPHYHFAPTQPPSSCRRHVSRP